MYRYSIDESTIPVVYGTIPTPEMVYAYIQVYGTDAYLANADRRPGDRPPAHRAPGGRRVDRLRPGRSRFLRGPKGAQRPTWTEQLELFQPGSRAHLARIDIQRSFMTCH